ncbi:hypothetical protein BG004_004656 [Podila humilis]|nr:hypothetical protein BG004_004656 [Podila humilis]
MRLQCTLPPLLHLHMLPNQHRIVREWPRYVIILLATYGFFFRACALFVIGNNVHSLDQITTEYVPGSLSPHEEAGISKAILVVTGIMSVAFNILVLYSAVTRSLRAAKFSLLGWTFGMSLDLLGWTVTFVSMVVAAWPDHEQTKVRILQLLVRLVPRWLLDVVFGWSLIVWLRDLRGQERNVLGTLRPAAKYLPVLGEDGRLV